MIMLHRLHTMHRCGPFASLQMSLSVVCVLDTPVSCAKTAEQIEMPFGERQTDILFQGTMY